MQPHQKKNVHMSAFIFLSQQSRKVEKPVEIKMEIVILPQHWLKELYMVLAQLLLEVLV